MNDQPRATYATWSGKSQVTVSAQSDTSLQQGHNNEVRNSSIALTLLSNIYIGTKTMAGASITWQAVEEGVADTLISPTQGWLGCRQTTPRKSII